MKAPYKYQAFLSYSHKDKDFVKWLHKSIENYRIPKTLRKKYPHLPESLKRSIFRDEDELSSGVLSNALKDAIANSEKLIVICSSNAVHSFWVEEEISYFQRIHSRNSILTVLLNGEHHDVLPKILNDNEPLFSVDARTNGNKKEALLKIIAAILEVDFADLWERDKKESRKRLMIKVLFMMLFISVGVYAYIQSIAISSNHELKKIEKRLTDIHYIMKHKEYHQDELYQLTEELKKLEEMKRVKEDTLKWFGILKTSVSKQAKEVYDKEGVDAALVVLESAQSLEEDELYAKKNMLRAKLYVEKSAFNQADHFYKKAVMIDSSYINLYEYALFLMEQKQYKKAKFFYEKLLHYDLPTEQEANVLNRLGILYRKTTEILKAESSYKKALVLREVLADNDPEKYKNDLAWTYNNLGVLYKENNQTNASYEAHSKAFKIRQSLMQNDPQTYTFHVSCSLHNLGELFSVTGKVEKAEKFFLDALKIRRELIKKNPKQFTPALANSLFELAILYDLTNRYKKAESLYLESLSLRRKLFSKNPIAYKEELIKTVDALYTLYMKMDKKDEAMRFHKELLILKANDAA